MEPDFSQTSELFELWNVPRLKPEAPCLCQLKEMRFGIVCTIFMFELEKTLSSAFAFMATIASIDIVFATI